MVYKRNKKESKRKRTKDWEATADLSYGKSQAWLVLQIICRNELSVEDVSAPCTCKFMAPSCTGLFRCLILISWVICGTDFGWQSHSVDASHSPVVQGAVSTARIEYCFVGLAWTRMQEKERDCPCTCPFLFSTSLLSSGSYLGITVFPTTVHWYECQLCHLTPHLKPLFRCCLSFAVRTAWASSVAQDPCILRLPASQVLLHSGLLSVFL